MLRPDRLITLGLVRPLQKVGLWPVRPGLPVLMYHSISDASEPGVLAYYRVNTSPKRFAEHMDFLHSAGYVGVDLETGMRMLNEGPAFKNSLSARAMGGEGWGGVGRSTEPSTLNPQPPSLRPVVLTFDDGYADFYTDAFPALQKHGFTATVFLSTAFIGDQHRHFAPAGGMRTTTARSPGALCLPRLFPRTPQPSTLNSQPSTLNPQPSTLNPQPSTLNPQPSTRGSSPVTRHLCLSWPEVRELRAAGMRFGSHTVNHPKLYDLGWSEIEIELRNSKRDIETRLGCPVTTFAYPYAYPQADRRFVEPFEALLSATGYRHNVTTCIGRVGVGANRLALNRLPVNDADDIPLLRAKLEGAYDWLGGAQAAVKGVKRRLSRRREPSGTRADLTAGLAPTPSPGPAGAE